MVFASMQVKEFLLPLLDRGIPSWAIDEAAICAPKCSNKLNRPLVLVESVLEEIAEIFKSFEWDFLSTEERNVVLRQLIKPMLAVKTPQEIVEFERAFLSVHKRKKQAKPHTIIYSLLKDIKVLIKDNFPQNITNQQIDPQFSRDVTKQLRTLRNLLEDHQHCNEEVFISTPGTSTATYRDPEAKALHQSSITNNTPKSSSNLHLLRLSRVGTELDILESSNNIVSESVSDIRRRSMDHSEPLPLSLHESLKENEKTLSHITEAAMESLITAEAIKVAPSDVSTSTVKRKRLKHASSLLKKNVEALTVEVKPSEKKANRLETIRKKVEEKKATEKKYLDNAWKTLTFTPRFNTETTTTQYLIRAHLVCLKVSDLSVRVKKSTREIFVDGICIPSEEQIEILRMKCMQTDVSILPKIPSTPRKKFKPLLKEAEGRFGKFYFVAKLPQKAALSNVSVQYSSPILTIQIPKSE
uniref:SHSP domain-containing protein n=1 Tax=Vannella robusta TaxID=1487602 RepID=A0A7S4I8L5_9EUKA